LSGGPEPFSWESPLGRVVNQTDQIEFAGHGRHLAADGPGSENESAVKHGHNLAVNRTRRTMKSQRTANSVLTGCLSRAVHLRAR
jgi:hypothetical protein